MDSSQSYSFLQSRDAPVVFLKTINAIGVKRSLLAVSWSRPLVDESSVCMATATAKIEGEMCHTKVEDPKKKSNESLEGNDFSYEYTLK